MQKVSCVSVCLAFVVTLTACSKEELLREVRREVSRQVREGERQEPAAPPVQPPVQRSQTAPRRSGDAITIASFNIQVFGTSKIKKPDVMRILAEIVRRYDVVAIQELRSKDDSIVPRFVQMINANGANYDCVVGPRLGRTSSKEQYVFVFDADRIAVHRNSIYTVSDPSDRLHREPLVATFQVRGLPTGQAFTFKLINIHTDPDETDTELDAMADVFTLVQHDGSYEDDVIVLGDLNVDERHLGRLGQLRGITWAIAGQKTNTRKTKSYDNLVFNRYSTSEFQGASGVLDLMEEFGLSQKDALRVSDHMPVWAQFSIYEGRQIGPVASRPGEAVR